jgi:hypothetical protein
MVYLSVRLSPKIKRDLLKLQNEIQDLTGLKISISNLIELSLTNFLNDLKKMGFLKG